MVYTVGVIYNHAQKLDPGRLYKATYLAISSMLSALSAPRLKAWWLSRISHLWKEVSSSGEIRYEIWVVDSWFHDELHCMVTDVLCP